MPHQAADGARQTALRPWTTSIANPRAPRRTPTRNWAGPCSGMATQVRLAWASHT